MAKLGVIEGGRERSVEEKVARHLRRLKGVGIYDEVLFTDEDGATRLGTVLDHKRDIQNSEDGTVRIGGNRGSRRVPIRSIIRVTVRIEEKISGIPPVASGEEDVDFFANTLGVREGIGAALGGRQIAGEGEPVGGQRRCDGTEVSERETDRGQVGGGNDNVVRLSDFRERKVR